MKTEDKESGGRSGIDAAPCIENCTSLNKNISHHPVLCQRCQDEYSIQEDGPDAGQRFACGIMVENMEAGNLSFNCCYFKALPDVINTVIEDKYFCGMPEKVCMCQPVDGAGPCGKPIAEVIDADRANESLRIVAILKKRPVIIPPPAASPHPFLDEILDYSRAFRKVR